MTVEWSSEFAEGVRPLCKGTSGGHSTVAAGENAETVGDVWGGGTA